MTGVQTCALPICPRARANVVPAKPPPMITMGGVLFMPQVWAVRFTAPSANAHVSITFAGGRGANGRWRHVADVRCAALSCFALRCDCLAMLELVARRRTRCAHWVRYAQTGCDKSVVDARCARGPRVLRFSAPQTRAARCPGPPLWTGGGSQRLDEKPALGGSLLAPSRWLTSWPLRLPPAANSQSPRNGGGKEASIERPLCAACRPASHSFKTDRSRKGLSGRAQARARRSAPGCRSRTGGVSSRLGARGPGT